MERLADPSCLRCSGTGKRHNGYFEYPCGCSRVSYSLAEHSISDCEHKELTLVFASGAKIQNGVIEKDFVVACADCKRDLFRIPARGRNITNLLP